MNKIKKLLLLLLVIALVSCVFVSGADSADIDRKVHEKIDSDGSANVTIMLKDDESMFRIQGTESKLEKRIAMVKSRQEKVLNNLNKKKFGALGKGKLNVKKRFSVVNGFSAEIDSAMLDELKKSPDVLSVELVRQYKISLDASVPLINAPDVWDFQVINNITGLGETVCIIDTGINYTHSALNHAYIGGHDYVNNDSNPYDDNGHGTHVAGIIASNDSAYRGVAPDARIVAMKSMNSAGSGDSYDIVAGISDCIANKSQYNISVISMSLGDGNSYADYCDADYDASLKSAIDLAVANEINVVVSSGNNYNKSGISGPACLQNATSVGAADKSDVVADYSQSADILDLLAPGNSITSSVVSGGFGAMSGTSMSAPHAAGAIVLMKQFLLEYNNTNLSVSTAINVLKRTGVNITDNANNITTPRIDILKAVLDFDVSVPALTLAYPENKSYLSYNISLNYSASDDLLLDKTWYSLSGINTTLNGNTTLNLSEGSYILNIYANDTAGNVNNIRVEFAVKLNNNAPVINSIPVLIGNTSETYNYVVNATDADDNSLNYNFIVNPDGMSFDSNIISWVPNKTQYGLFDVNINVSDGLYGVNQSYVLNISYVNHQPYLILNISIDAWSEDTNKIVDINSYFGDDDADDLNFSYSPISNISVSISNSTNIATLTPDSNFSGIRYIVFTAYDSEFNVSSNNITLTINNVADCGDGTCESGETCSSCSTDCGACPATPATSTGGSGGGGTALETEEEETVETASSTENSDNSGTQDESTDTQEKEAIKEIAQPTAGLFAKLFDIIKSPFVLVKNIIARIFSWIF